MTRRPRSVPSPLALALTLSAAACSAPRSTMAPVDVLGAHDLTYQASYACAGLPLPTFEPLEVEPAGEPPRRIRVTSDLVSLERELATQVLGPRARGLCAFRIPASEHARLEQWLEREGLELVNTTVLEQYDGQRASLSVIHQQAYIGAFQVEATPDVMVADPVIDVLSSGFLLDLRGDFTEQGPIDLELHLTHSRRPTTIPTRTLRIPGARSPVTLQLPELLLEELSTRVLLAPDEVLVLGGVEGQDGRALFALLRAEEPLDAPGD